jgi:intein-encoded DNA endonuclease-like protein
MRLNKLQIADLCDQYLNGLSSHQLAKMYGISSVAVCRLLDRRGIQRRAHSDPIHRKCTLNELAFDCITEESAYWIGFLMADGSIIERTANSTQVALVLHDKDRSHIEKFKQFLGSSHAIIPIEKPPTNRFAVRSKYLADALSRYGVLPKKTHTTKVIGLENNRDFWRGVVDGDGYIGFHKGKARIDLVGSETLLSQFMVQLVGMNILLLKYFTMIVLLH